MSQIIKLFVFILTIWYRLMANIVNIIIKFRNQLIFFIEIDNNLIEFIWWIFLNSDQILIIINFNCQRSVEFWESKNYIFDKSDQTILKYDFEYLCFRKDFKKEIFMSIHFLLKKLKLSNRIVKCFLGILLQFELTSYVSFEKAVIFT